jgi:hypothetical protein
LTMTISQACYVYDRSDDPGGTSTPGV